MHRRAADAFRVRNPSQTSLKARNLNSFRARACPQNAICMLCLEPKKELAQHQRRGPEVGLGILGGAPWHREIPSVLCVFSRLFMCFSWLLMHFPIVSHRFIMFFTCLGGAFARFWPRTEADALYNLRMAEYSRRLDA